MVVAMMFSFQRFCLNLKRLSECHDGANRLALVHEVERVVDLLDRHHVRDEVVDVDLLIHVPVNDLRRVGTAAGASERTPLPHTTGDELEWTGLDLLSGTGDSDDHRHTPAAVATLERLAHELDGAHAREAVIRAAVRERNPVLHQVAPPLLRLDAL